jgi:hypothetical protein
LLGNLYKFQSTPLTILFTKLRNTTSPFFAVDAGHFSISGNHTFFTSHQHMSALATQRSWDSTFLLSVVNLALTKLSLFISYQKEQH